MESRGQDPKVELTTWYKRTTLPMAVPLLACLGLFLGARGVRPAVTATSIGVGWWAVMRVCDHAVNTLGALNSVLVPLAGLVLVCVWSWRRWPER